jgi:hypothetical protein
MKRHIQVTILCASLIMCIFSGCNSRQSQAARSASGQYNPEDFIGWMQGGNATAATTAGFLKGARNRPNDEELVKILEIANTYFECHGLGGAHFIVVKSQQKQEEIMQLFKQRMGLSCDGTVMVLVMADGVKSQEYHAAQYYPGLSSQNGGKPEYWQMAFGIYEAGWASAYLNLAARSLGYRTRAFAALNIFNNATKSIDHYTAGNWDYLTREYWEISEFMQSRDGSTEFMHYVPILKDYIPIDGNVTLLCVILIGKINEADAVSSATKFNEKVNNYDFWD